MKETFKRDREPTPVFFVFICLVQRTQDITQASSKRRETRLRLGFLSAGELRIATTWRHGLGFGRDLGARRADRYRSAAWNVCSGNVVSPSWTEGSTQGA